MRRCVAVVLIVLKILHGLVCSGRIWHQTLPDVNLIHRTFQVALLVHVLKVAFVKVSLVNILVFRIMLFVDLTALIVWIDLNFFLMTFVFVASVQVQ